MNTYWGVVSTRPANAPVTSISGQPALFNFIVQQVGTPQFWGRYIAGKAQCDLLTAEETTSSITIVVYCSSIMASIPAETTRQGCKMQQTPLLLWRTMRAPFDITPGDF